MSSSKHISLQDQQFNSYLEGNLSEKEMKELEEELANNYFYKDALEGYKAYPEGIASLSKLKTKYGQITTSNLVTSFYTSFILVSLIFGGAFIFYLNNSSSIILKDILESKIIKAGAEELIIKSIPIQELTEDNIDSSVLKQEVKQVYYDIAIHHYVTNTTDSLEMGGTEDVIKIKQNPIAELKKEKVKDLVSESVPLISLYGLINVNYSNIESQFKFKKTRVVLTGVPANLEDNGAIREEPSHELRTDFISYEKYLGDIQYYFSRNKFKKSLKGYKEILKQHPTDINAHFYSAICYYNINQPEKALEHLDVVILHQYDTFRQEGEWYKAQVLYDLNREKEAETLLDKIIRRNDFYTEQAKDLKQQSAD